MTQDRRKDNQPRPELEKDWDDTAMPAVTPSAAPAAGQAVLADEWPTHADLLAEDLEKIAETWTGCMYDAPGESIDIGADLRAQFAKLKLADPVAAATEQAIPEGWKLVPVELTPEMRKAYENAAIAPMGSISKWGYRAMLEKVPAAPLATPADAGAGLTMVMQARSPEGDPWQEVSAEDFFKAHRNGCEVSVCVNKADENSIRLEAPAPVTAEPVAWGLLEIQEPELTNDNALAAYWARKGRNVTPLYTAPAPADRDAIRDQALTNVRAKIDAAMSCHPNAVATLLSEAVELIDEQVMERAAGAAETRDAKGGGE